jgi:hypothetical protein
MIKPGTHDRKYYLLLTKEETDELVWNSSDLIECFGLDKRIAKYKGKKPLGLYRWDIEALYEIYNSILDNDPDNEYFDKESSQYITMRNLVQKIKILYDEAFKDVI